MAIVATHSMMERLAANDLPDFILGSLVSPSYDDTAGPFGSARMQTSVLSTREMLMLLPAPSDTVTVGFWWQWGSNSLGESEVWTFGNGEGSLQIALTQTLVRVRSGGSNLASGPWGAYEGTNGPWTHFEVRVERLNVDDVQVSVWFDGNVVLDEEVVPSPFGADPIEWTGIWLNYYSGSTTNRQMRWAGLVVDDEGDRLGRLLVYGRLPDAQGAEDDFTGSVTDVNAAPPSANAIEGSPGDVTTYTLDAFPLPGGHGDIAAVGQVAFARSTGGTDVRGVCRRSGTNEATDETLDLTGDFQGLRRAYWFQDPHTAAPWDIEDIDASEFGLVAEAT